MINDFESEIDAAVQAHYKEMFRAISTNILHFLARVVVSTWPDRSHDGGPRFLRALLRHVVADQRI